MARSPVTLGDFLRKDPSSTMVGAPRPRSPKQTNKKFLKLRGWKKRRLEYRLQRGYCVVSTKEVNEIRIEQSHGESENSETRNQRPCHM